MKKVISSENLPIRSPFWLNILILLALDYWKAPQWLWGMMILVLVCVWIGYFILKAEQVQCNIIAKVFPPKPKYELQEDD